MKSLLNILISAPVLLFTMACNASMKNSKSVSVKISGNCEMCEQTIETAANVKDEVSLDWNKDNKIAIVSYDSTKTNTNEILKRVALAGYDNEKFLAPDDAYQKLAACCKYERSTKKATQEPGDAQTNNIETKQDSVKQTVEVNQLILVSNYYFDLKNALIKANTASAAEKAKDLSQALSSVKMEKLQDAQHIVWMKVYKSLIAASESITKSKNVEAQRAQFITLSENMYGLMKVAQLETPVYYQNCPMYNDGKGANWLSLENNVKNPYYGSQMLTCGKTIETIK